MDRIAWFFFRRSFSLTVVFLFAIMGTMILIVQTPIAYAGTQIKFQKLYGSSVQDVGFSGLQARDGAYVFAGSTDGIGSDNGDGYLIKIDLLGDTVWTRAFNASNYDYFVSVQQTLDGGYIAAGLTTGGVGSDDYYLVKTDSLGGLMWSKVYGGVTVDAVSKVIQTNGGGYLIAGNTASFGAGSLDAYLVRVDASGDTVWTRTFGSPATESIRSVIQTRDGGFVAVGGVYDSQTFDNDMYILKTTAGGGTSWIQSIGGPPPETRPDVACSVIQTLDGGYIIAGTSVFGTDVDMVLIKTDSVGGPVWMKRYGGPAAEFCFDVKQTRDSGFVVAGSTFSFSPGGNLDSYLLKTDVNGNLLWSMRYGQNPTDEMQSVVQSSDGGYLLTGYQSFSPTGFRDIYIIKTDGAGNSGCIETDAQFVSGPATLAIANQFALTSPGCFVNPVVTGVRSGASVITLCTSVAVEEENALMPWDFELGQNYPNPFNPSTKIVYRIGSRGFVSLKVFDVLGREVAVLVDEAKEPGEHSVVLDGSHLSSGVYFYRFTVGSFIETKKLVLLK